MDYSGPKTMSFRPKAMTEKDFTDANVLPLIVTMDKNRAFDNINRRHII